MNNYSIFDLNGRSVYLFQDFIDNLSEIDAIIFDVDGVLIDSRNSYDKTIQKTISYFASKYAEFKLPRSEIPEKIISLKKIVERNVTDFSKIWKLSQFL